MDNSRRPDGTPSPLLAFLILAGYAAVQLSRATRPPPEVPVAAPPRKSDAEIAGDELRAALAEMPVPFVTSQPGQWVIFKHTMNGIATALACDETMHYACRCGAAITRWHNSTLGYSLFQHDGHAEELWHLNDNAERHAVARGGNILLAVRGWATNSFGC